MGSTTKGLAEVQVGNIHSLSLFHQAGHQVMKGDQVGQAGPAFPKPILAGADALVVLSMVCDCTQDNLFHNLPRK